MSENVDDEQLEADLYAYAHRVARKHTADEDVATQAASDAFAAWKEAKDVIRTPRPWLKVVTRHRVYKLGPRAAIEQPVDVAPSDDEDGDLHASKAVRMLHGLEYGRHSSLVANRIVLEERFAMLNEGAQEILTLRYVDGFLPSEIAEELKLDVALVHTRLSRARAAMRELLADVADDLF